MLLLLLLLLTIVMNDAIRCGSEFESATFISDGRVQRSISFAKRRNYISTCISAR